MIWGVGEKMELLALFTLTLCVVTQALDPRADVILQLEPVATGGFSLSLKTGENKTIYGIIGRTLLPPYTIEEVKDGVDVQISGVNLTVRTFYESQARGIKIKWEANEQAKLEDCFDFGTHHWYGGPMQYNQTYPIENAKLVKSSYVTHERDNRAIAERYWFNTGGQYFYVHPEVPLFVDYKNLLADHLCFSAEIADPYSSKRTHVSLSYDMWFLSDAKSAHQHAVANYLGKPAGLPDYRMVQHPIWSTWAQYSREIDETNLLEYATEIRERGFNNSQLEIDDLWEVCYGSLTVNEDKFSNFSKLVQDIKAMGYRVTIWIHPFINRDCEPWYSIALENGYLVRNEDNSTEATWWNNNGTASSYVDFTNPAAADWWHGRVKHLLDTYDIDSAKFDAGESNFSPQIPVQAGDIDLHPHHITQAYVKTCARFGDMIEVRTGFRTQNLPVFIRMVDRDSIWGTNNGLPTIITTSIQMSLAGYPMILPDMIGGNGFNLPNEESGLPTKELFIRWVQANTFLPAMQFSFVPWMFDNETVQISLKYTELHAQYADAIYAALNASVTHGSPSIAPLWWIDPHDAQAQQVSDEFLLGENILVAPVIHDGARSRDVYLPAGKWLAEGNSEEVHEGPGWIRSFPAPLDTLPYFIRDQSSPGAATSIYVTSALVLLGLLANFRNGF